jgi:hypothetical protein
MLRSHCAWTVPLLVALIAHPAAAQKYNENVFRVRPQPPTTLTFAPTELPGRANGGTIEFWVRHQDWPSVKTPFREGEYKGSVKIRPGTALVPYSVLIAFGNNDKLSLAVTVSPGKTSIKDSTSPAAGTLLGIANSFEQLGDARRMVELKAVEGKTESPLSFSLSSYYHVALIKKPKDAFLTVYVDGLEQGTIQGDFGDLPAAPLHVGWDLGPRTTDAGDDTLAQAWTYDGYLGGLRIWMRPLSPASIVALRRFGRTPRLDKLTLLKEYGDLLAFADFTGDRWDHKDKTWRDDGPPRIRIADPFAGVWRSEDDKVLEDPETGAMSDFPVYTFVQATHGYNVYEDDWYIGLLTPRYSQRQAEPAFVFRREGNNKEPPITFTPRRMLERGATRSEWKLVCDALPAEIVGKMAGRGPGEPLTLVRASLETIVNDSMDDLEARNAAATADLSQKFMLGNNLRYRDILYRGYNVTQMNPYDLRTTGIRRDDVNGYVLRPTQNQEEFSIDTNQLRVMPFDLAISNKNKGIKDSVSLLLSSSSEYAQAFTSRIGAGVNMQLSGSFLGVGANYTFAISGQYDNAVEQIANSTQDVHLVVTNSYVQHYALYHHKQYTRLNEDFQNAVRGLRQATAAMSDEERGQRFMSFHRDWGTHYCFGATFGAMGFWESRIDKESTDLTNISRELAEIGINEGKTGIEDKLSERVGNSLSAENTRAVVIGGIQSPGSGDSLSPGDEPSPIRLELRPMFQLLTPQHFPNEPDIYLTLREQHRNGLANYVKAEAVAALNKVKADAAKKKLVLPGAAGRPEIPITVADVERYEREIAAYGGATGRTRTLAVRLKGLSYDEYQREGKKVSQDRTAGLAKMVEELKNKDSSNPVIAKLEALQNQAGPTLTVTPRTDSGASKTITLEHVFGPTLGFYGKIDLVPFAINKTPIVGDAPNQTLQAELQQFLAGSRTKTIWEVAETDAVPLVSGDPRPNPGGVNRGMIYSWDVPDSGLLDFVGIQVSAYLDSTQVGARPRSAAISNYYMRAWSGPNGYFGKDQHNFTLDNLRPNRAMIWGSATDFSYAETDGQRRTWRKSDADIGRAYGETKTRHFDGSNPIAHDVRMSERANPLRVFKKSPNGIEWEQGTLVLGDVFRGKDTDDGNAAHVGVVTLHFEYSVLPNLQELLERTKAAGSGDKRKWGNFQSVAAAPTAFEDRHSVASYVLPFAIHDPIANELNRTIPAGFSDARIPPRSAAYYAFGGNGADAAGRAAALVGPQGEAVDTRRFQDHAYVRGAKELQLGGDFDDAARNIVDKAPLPMTQDVMEVPLTSGGGFSVHMDFTRGLHGNGDMRAIGDGDSGTLLVRGDGEFSLDASDQLRLYNKGADQKNRSIGRFRGLRPQHSVWQKLIVAVDVEARQLRALVGGQPFEQPLPDTYLPPTSSRWSFGDCAGSVDELIFFDHALSWDEINQLKLRPRVTKEETLADGPEATMP